MQTPRMPNNTLTWAMLLARWTEYAQTAVALPADGEAGRFKQAVPPVISLAALTYALGELDQLEPDERALALDRAEIQIRADIARLDAIWAGLEPPESIWVFVEDAARALAGVCADENGQHTAGFEWIVAEDGAVFEHPGPLLMALASVSPTLEVWVPSPGVPFFCGAVACHVADVAGVDEEVLGLVAGFLGDDAEGPIPVETRHQTIRQFDFSKDGAVRDVVVRADETDCPGQALLVAGVIPDPGCDSAEVGAVAMPPRGREPMNPLPVEVLDPGFDPMG